MTLADAPGTFDDREILDDRVVVALRQTLLSWYAQQGRDLPWRKTQDPYAIWVAEIMLQQTQVRTVLPYYERWLSEFPTTAALAAAEQQRVLKLWQGLGYYARARNLHRAAQQVMQQFNGQFPADLALAISLAGIGRTTAGGILSLAFNLPTPILDGNVKRVLARLVALPKPPSRALPQLWQISQTLLDPAQPRHFNQAIMDLGATCCQPKRPDCLRCPWNFCCRAYQTQMQNDLPQAEPRPRVPHKQIGVAVIWNAHRQVLIDRRRQAGLLGGLWEFPGGKLEAGETIEHCIQREIQEELGIEIAVGAHLISIDHAYSHFHVTLNVYHCRHLSGEPQPLECDELRWVEVAELEQFAFPVANVKIIQAIQALQSAPG